MKKGLRAERVSLDPPAMLTEPGSCASYSRASTGGTKPGPMDRKRRTSIHVKEKSLHFLLLNDVKDRRMTMRKTKGFTLIELLIVVAIIGILAAIAIPNFLMAQARAKVSRAMADMKSVANAMEHYRVDHSSYPVEDNGGEYYYVGWLMVYPADSSFYIGERLTTPIDYMTTVPMDTFNSAIMGENIDRRYSFWINTLGSGQVVDGFEEWYEEMHNAVGGWFPRHPGWVMESCGPSLHWWEGGSLSPSGRDPHAYFYDPTNGTLSTGMLSICNEGFISPRQ